VATDNASMAAKREKYISRAIDKRAIIVTLWETLDGHIFPFQLISTGKIERHYQMSNFVVCLAYNPKHWSNENEILRLIEDVLVPYIAKIKEEKSLPESQKASCCGMLSKLNRLKK